GVIGIADVERADAGIEEGDEGHLLVIDRRHAFVGGMRAEPPAALTKVTAGFRHRPARDHHGPGFGVTSANHTICLGSPHSLRIASSTSMTMSRVLPSLSLANSAIGMSFIGKVVWAPLNADMCISEISG